MGNEKRIRSTVVIVKAYLEANQLPAWDLPGLIAAVGDSLLAVEAAAAEPAPVPAQRAAPVAPPGRSFVLRHERKSRFNPMIVTRH